MSNKYFEAAQNDNLSLAKQLSQSNSDINGANNVGETPLIVAVRHGSHNVMNFLLASSAKTYLRDHRSRTALHWAVDKKDDEAMHALLNFHASTDAYDEDSNTPIMLAQQSNVKALENIFEEFEITNYHADRLVLRRDIESLVEDHDIVTDVSNQFRALTPYIKDEKYRERLLELSTELYQPEELIAFSQNALGRKAAEAKLNKDKKKDKSSEKRNTLRERLTRISKEFSKIDSASMEGYLTCDLTKDSPIFKRLNKLITIIDELREEFLPLMQDLPQLSAIFLKLKQFYLTYIDEICRFRGEMRQDLFMGRIRMQGFLGSRYLRFGAALRFKEFFKKITLSSSDSPDSTTAVARRDNEHGLHSVIHLLHTFYKVKPSAPAVEHMVDSLNKIISGQGSAPTELLFFEKGPELLPILASKAVYGENLLELLIEHPDYVHLIVPFNYSTHFVMSLLTRFDDAKLDNFMAVLEKNTQSKVIRLIIVGVDNDLAFKDVILLHPEGRFAGKHFVEMKSAFLLMPQMNQPIDPQFAQLFLKHIPELVIMKLLKTLLLQDNQYQEYRETFAARMNSENSLRKDRIDNLNKQFQEINLPLKLIPGTILKLYQDIQAIQAILRKTPQIKHHDLLNAFNQILAAYYKHIREERSTKEDNPTWPRIVNDQAYLYRRPFLEDVLHPSLLHLGPYNRTDQEHVNLATETLTEASENFVNALDYEKLDSIHLESELLEKVMTDFSFVKTLTIRNCQALSDYRLESIAQNFKSLETITLINCSNVKGNGLSALLCHRKEIKLVIEEMPQLSVTCLLDLLQHHSNVTIKLDGNSYVVKEKTADLLKVVMLKEDYYTLVTALLIRGTHLNTEHTFSPLHIATQSGLTEVIEEFIRYGASLDSTDHEKRTVLDIASEQYNKERDVFKKAKRQKNVVTLFIAGAFHCKNPSDILTIAIRSLTPDKYATQSSLLEKLFNFAHCHNLLNSELVAKLIPTGLKTLDLSVPRHMNLGQHHVSLDVIKALKYRLGALEHLNITGCAGLSIDILKEMASWQLTSLSMSYEQVAMCKLISMETINEAGNLRLADRLLTYNHITAAEHRISYNPEIRITHLNLSGKKSDIQGKQGDKIVTEINALLIRSQYLTDLELANCGITETRLKPIMDGLVYNKSVKLLMLSHNPLTEEGVKYLFDKVLHNTPPALMNLRELYLDAVGAKSDSGTLIGELIHKHEALEVLSFYRNSLGDEGVVAIANGIQMRLRAQKTGGRELKLRQLHLNEVGMGDQGARALSRALLFHSGLAYLDVGFNTAINNVGLLALIELLELSTSIQIFKGDGLAAEADIMLKNQYKFLAQNRKHGVQLARLDKLAKSNQIQWQRHAPEIFTKIEEDESYQHQVKSMSQRIQEQENEIARLKKLLGLPEISETSVQVTESSNSPIVAKTPRPVIGRTRTNSPSPTSTTATTVFFDAATSVKTGIKNEIQKLLDLGCKFDYSQDTDQFNVKVISDNDNVDSKQFSNLWQLIIKSIENYDGSNKEDTEQGLLLKGLTDEQIKKLENLLKEVGIISSTNVLQH